MFLQSTRGGLFLTAMIGHSTPSEWRHTLMEAASDSSPLQNLDVLGTQRWVRYVEPANQRFDAQMVFMPRATAVQCAVEAAAAAGHRYDTEDRALDEFLAVHLAEECDSPLHLPTASWLRSLEPLLRAAAAGQSCSMAAGDKLRELLALLARLPTPR